MTFSIRYETEGEGSYTELAVDWDWNIKRQWAMSDKEGPGSRWYATKGLDKRAYEAILQHFGLGDYESEFPIEKVIAMSPEELGKARREKERCHGLEHISIMSDTLGEHVLIS